MFAAVLAGAATFSSGAFSDPATACAAPREWDIAFYDDCIQAASDAWQADEISYGEWQAARAECCEASGGVYDYGLSDRGCTAPPAEQAQEAERQPAPPEFGMTLYMPPPVGPVAPPPSQVMQAP